MNEMPKPQYLSKDDKGRKLRRPVPKVLQTLAGKTAWVERLGKVSWDVAVERAHLFAVETDMQLKELKAKQRIPTTYQKYPDKNEPRFTGGLASTDVNKIAIAYFSELEKDIQNSDGYRSGINAVNKEQLIEDLSLDHAAADAIAVGDSSSTLLNQDENIKTVFHQKALRQLLKYGYVETSDLTEEEPQGRARKNRLKIYCVPVDLVKDANFSLLARKLAEADAEISRRRLEAVSDNREPSLQVPLFAEALNPNAKFLPTKTHSVGELIDEFLNQKKLEVGLSRFDQFKIATRALHEELGRSTPVANVGRSDLQTIADLFVRIPAYATRHYKTKTLRQAAEAFEKKNGESAGRHSEAQKNAAVLKQIFELAVDREWIGQNPALRLKISKPARPSSYSEQQEGYKPFSIEELNLIFSRPLYIGCQDDGFGINKVGDNFPRRSRFWLPLISLFSGMRMQEILQLERSDVLEDNGIFYISINDKIEGTDYVDGEYNKNLKTKNSVRNVPVHPELIKIGFLDYVSNSEREWLFSDVSLGSGEKLSGTFSKKFQTFLKPTGVWVPRRKVFHSFRNTFNDALRDAGVPRELREPIMGWEDKKRMDNRYGDGHAISKLAAEVARVEYNGLNLSHLYTDAIGDEL